MSPVLLVRLRTTCVSVAVTRARPALTRSARGRLGGSCVRWGRARALAAPGTLCRRSGDFPLGGRGALEEPVSSVRGLASRSSEHPGVRGPPPPPYMRRGAGVPSRTERASFAAPRFPPCWSPQATHRQGGRRPPWRSATLADGRDTDPTQGTVPPREYIKQIARRGSAPEAGSSSGCWAPSRAPRDAAGSACAGRGGASRAGAGGAGGGTL